MDSLQKLTFGATGWGDELLLGALMTVLLALGALVIGLGIAAGLAFLKLQPVKPVRGIAHSITLLFRGTPEFLIILVVFFGLDLLINGVLSALGTELTVSTPKFWAGALGLGLIFGVYASEVFKGAYLNVSTGILEAARALGLNPLQTLSQVHIPLMWRFALPGLMNLWLVLLKDTSLVAVIAFDELLRTAKVAGETEREPFVFFLAAAALYLILTYISDRGRRVIEAKSAIVGHH
jgi:His/Glu/Gln/Arg/opine family amino acid ABC transporter permease subunit